ncbi:MAG TPA: TRCF domain-containing protein, partial [Propionibacteriaceae bacterium]
DVGFDLYIQLVGEAVAEYRGHEVEPEAEVRIELPIDAHLPTDYIESERLRLEMYKRLAEVRAEADVKAVEAELHDRYGTPPQEVLNLLEVARLRLLARSGGLTEIVGQGRFVRFAPAHLPESRVMRLQRRYPGSVVKDAVGTVLVPRPATSGAVGEPLKDTDLLRWASELIREIFTDS